MEKNAVNLMRCTYVQHNHNIYVYLCMAGNAGNSLLSKLYAMPAGLLACCMTGLPALFGLPEYQSVATGG